MDTLLQNKKELVTNVRQKTVNKDTDRWSIGLCICEFYTGKTISGNREEIEEIEIQIECWKIHFYLCYIYYLSVRPGEYPIVDSIRVTKLPQLFGGVKLDSQTYNTMIDLMIQYCLPKKVRSIIEGTIVSRAWDRCIGLTCSPDTGIPPGVGDDNVVEVPPPIIGA